MAYPKPDIVDMVAFVLHSLVSYGKGHTATIKEGHISILVEMVEGSTSCWCVRHMVKGRQLEPHSLGIEESVKRQQHGVHTELSEVS
jgi:hypothetical protein